MKHEKNVSHSLLWWANGRFKWRYTISLIRKPLLEVSSVFVIVCKVLKTSGISSVNLGSSSLKFLEVCNCCFCIEKAVVCEEMFACQIDKGKEEIRRPYEGMWSSPWWVSLHISCYEFYHRIGPDCRVGLIEHFGWLSLAFWE